MARRLLVPLLVLLSSTAARAHEIGTTRVTIIVHQDRTYAVEIVTDGAALLDKLEASAGGSARGDLQSDELASVLGRLDPLFRKRATLAFDNVAPTGTTSYAVAAPTDVGATAVATIRITGRVPDGAQRLTWSYGWTFASYALIVNAAGSRSATTEWLEGGERSRPVTLSAPTAPDGRVRSAARYLALGFTHIVPGGVDHMLFVLGIFLLGGGRRAILWQVSAFTIAHSITLGLSLYGFVAVPPRIVEPAIALSIAYVAIENLFLSDLKPWRVALVFAFGLLHGMGFAGALKDLALPRAEFLTALVTFNAGVELGQLTVIAAAFLLVGWPCADRSWYRRRIVVPASALIACTAAYWTVARLSL